MRNHVVPTPHASSQRLNNLSRWERRSRAPSVRRRCLACIVVQATSVVGARVRLRGVLARPQRGPARCSPSLGSEHAKCAERNREGCTGRREANGFSGRGFGKGSDPVSRNGIVKGFPSVTRRALALSSPIRHNFPKQDIWPPGCLYDKKDEGETPSGDVRPDDANSGGSPTMESALTSNRTRARPVPCRRPAQRGAQTPTGPALK